MSRCVNDISLRAAMSRGGFAWDIGARSAAEPLADDGVHEWGWVHSRVGPLERGEHVAAGRLGRRLVDGEHPRDEPARLHLVADRSREVDADREVDRVLLAPAPGP